MGIATVIALICLLGAALSVKSVIVLGRNAPWTSAGWWLTLLYLFAVTAKSTFAPGIPAYAEYLVLGALSVAFVIAGTRDERQAEPWWWPSRLGMTRTEKRRST